MGQIWVFLLLFLLSNFQISLVSEKRRKIDLYRQASIPTFEVWLLCNADAPCTWKGEEGDPNRGRILCFNFSCPALKYKFNLITFQNGNWNYLSGVPVVVQWLTNPTRNHEVTGSIPGLMLSGLRIWRCLELWYRLQTRLRSPSCCGSGVGRWLQLRLDPKPGNLHLLQEWP